MTPAEEVAALERELAHSLMPKPGGQPPDPSRTAAIEDALKVARGRAAAEPVAAPAGGDLETADGAVDLETADGPKPKSRARKPADDE